LLEWGDEMLRKELHQANRLAWNEATAAHNSHKRDQAAYLRAGGGTLYPEELALLGDLSGKTLLHLQCNAGQDTLSLAQQGAIVTGVDISDTAIDFARGLSAESGVPGAFVRADVYDWLVQAALDGRHFDRVFSSYGAVVWLSDLASWAQGIAAVLAPGGRFVLIDFHPFSMVFEWDWTLKYPYFNAGKPAAFESGIGDYVAMSGAALAPSGYLEGVADFKNPHPGYEFNWTIAEVLGVLLGAGLAITAYREYPYANGAKLFSGMRELPGGRMAPPEGVPALPLMYGVAAEAAAR
jgi:SAM-dependent methyltransferase